MKYPHIKIVAHSVYDDADRVATILEAGALGFVSKKSGFEELIRAIKTVKASGRFICPETAWETEESDAVLVRKTIFVEKEEIFSRREREVLNMLSKGKSSREIAHALFITERTVESHRKNMIKKADVKNTVALIAYASSLDLIKK